MDEEALPAEVVITSVESAGADRFRVHLQFTYRDTFETRARPPNDSNTFRWTGIAIVALEAGRYAVDDYVPIDHHSGRTLAALSKDFPECKGGRWVGLKGQRY